MDGSNEILIFDHIAENEEKGRIMDNTSLVQFVAGIGMSIVEGSLCSFRLVKSNTPCIVTEKDLYLVPFSMFPEDAKAQEGELAEGALIASSLKKRLDVIPISLACLSGSGSEALAGESYVVKICK